MMRDPQYYPEPDAFDPTRYTRLASTNDNNTPRQRFTDVSRTWPVWGLGTAAWYVAQFSPEPV